MRVVFDTNVLYSAFVAKGFCEEVVDEAAGECSIIWSHLLEKEFTSVLTRRHKVGPATRSALEAFVELCEFVAPEPLPKRVCRDKDDDVVLATAVAGKADVIVTGDDDLIDLESYEGVRIINPRQFMELLDRNS